MRTNRRGRPRSDRPVIDLGTPELRAKRQFALGPQRRGWPEPLLNDAEHALGIMLWRGDLAPEYEASKRMYDAGIMFAGWWRVVYPKTSPTGTLGSLQPGSSGDPDIEHARACLTSASLYLANKSRSILDAVINAVVYNGIQPRKVQHLRTGLCRLIEWRRAQRKAA